MSPWSLLTSLVLLVLLRIPEVQGQTCSMVTQTDKKISDAFFASIQILSGPTDFDSCSTACLGEADCAVVEYRSGLCLSLGDDTALVDQAGAASALKVCTNAGTTTTVAYESTTEDTGANTTLAHVESTTEDTALATRPRLIVVVMTTVMAFVWRRRE